jgi:hypothetical protein
MAIITKYWERIYVWFPGSGAIRRFDFGGNTVPAQLSLPKYIVPSLSRHQEAGSDGSPSRNEGKRFFFTTFQCGAFLFLTGLFMKM